MPRNTYLYENIMFTNKVRCSIGKEERKKLKGERKKP